MLLYDACSEHKESLCTHQLGFRLHVIVLLDINHVLQVEFGGCILFTSLYSSHCKINAEKETKRLALKVRYLILHQFSVHATEARHFDFSP